LPVPDPFGAELDALPDGPDGIDWGPAGPPGRGARPASRRRGPSTGEPRTRPEAAEPGGVVPGPGGFVAAQRRSRPAGPRAGRAARGTENGAERRPRTGPGRLVRPYMVSGGRTSSDTLALEMEALIVTTSLGEASLRALARERRQIAELCRDVLSVAEISAHLDVPFGVACVLVGDLAGEGMVQVHRPASPDARPDLALLERVLYGLRDL
jgi:hypothetical protein